MTEFLTVFAAPMWAYLALFAFLAVDALIPVVPTQAIMITSGALTVYGGLDLAAVISVGAAGMFTGDALAFVLGRSTGARLSALRDRFAPRHEESDSRTRRAAERFTRGLRRPGPLVILLCRFVPGGRIASGYHAGRSGYPIRAFIGYDVAAALGWAAYGGLVGHLGGTAITQSAWRLFAVAAAAAVVFGTAGWMLALFGGTDEPAGHPARAATGHAARAESSLADEPATGGGEPEPTGSRAASADAPPPR